MTALSNLCHSTLGKKYLMALTGVGLFGFVVAHMIGNLQVFLGADVLNTYARFIKSKAVLLWGVRLGLLAMVFLHILTAVQLTLRNRAARPEKYDSGKPYKATFASRTLALTGAALFAFIVYHLMHFTVGVVDPAYLQLRDSLGRHDVYRMTILGFSHPGVSAFYIAAMALLCLHLSHGVGSTFQSLGFKNKKTAVWIDRISKTLAVVVFLGNSSMPLAVLAGILR
ncbi:MAG: succinate dehydrogenase cytochrome b subunit [Acidobacteria bacterium]|nr:succinate dehydrogenase cytochrome b subunit [Acidobacteriota bacterium]